MPRRHTQFSSDAFAISRFPLHGQTTVDVDGALLRALVRGPFNLELVQAQCRLLAAAGQCLPANRRYLELIEYQQSLLMPAAAWATMEAFIEQGVRGGFCALTTVLVLPPDVEGETLFRERVIAMWSRSRPVEVCTTREAGEALLSRLQREHGLAPGPADHAPASTLTRP